MFTKGIKFTEEHKRKLSEAKRRRPVTYWKGKKRPGMTGDKNPNFKKGKHKNTNGYIRLSSRQYEHRAVMEAHIGRKLLKQEHVHHIDGDKSNNKISNLMLFPTNSAHQKYHQLLNKK